MASCVYVSIQMTQMDDPLKIALGESLLQLPQLSSPTVATQRGVSSGEWSALDAYLRELRNDSLYPKLSHEEALALGSAAFAGDRTAIDSLVRGHLRLVVKIARQYIGFGLAISDLVAEGNLGLLRAAEMYNPNFGTRFSTYATVWIRQRIHRAITAQARVVRIPVWRSQRLRKWCRVEEELSLQLGRPAKEEEVAGKLGMELDALWELQGDRIEVISMDASTYGNEEDGKTFAECLADDAAQHPAERLGKEELREEILACLADLDDREIQVLALKFGLSTANATSFRELGRRLGLSHEWVRRIAELALVKVRRAFSESARWTLSERLERIHSATVRVCAAGSMC